MKLYRHIENVYTNTTHVLLAKNTLLRRPLERSNTRILDFIEVLYTLGDINHQVRTSGFRSETPDLSGLSNIPAVGIRKYTTTSFEIITSIDFTSLNSFCELFVKWHGLDVETVMLVLGL